MRLLLRVLCLLLLATSGCGEKVHHPTKSRSTLILTTTEGYRHESIEAGLALFQREAANWKLALTHSESPELMRHQRYDLLILLQTTGDFLDSLQQESLKEYVHSGGRILAIHAATDAEYNWPWFGQLLGARFDSHPATQQASCTPTNHPAASALPNPWTRTDEWYNFKHFDTSNHPVLLVDELSYSGGTMGNPHPIAWTRNFEGGRIFYTGLGHTPESYEEPAFVRHIAQAVDWLLQEGE